MIKSSNRFNWLILHVSRQKIRWNNKTMMLNTKQLEELDNIQEVAEELTEEQLDTESSDDGAESALAWRRGMIERAVANVKKAAKRLIPGTSFPAGTLVFDKDKKRFARIVQATLATTELSYLSGDNGEFESTPRSMSNKETLDEEFPLDKPKKQKNNWDAVAPKELFSAPKAKATVKVTEKTPQRLEQPKTPKMAAQAKPTIKKLNPEVGVVKASAKKEAEQKNQGSKAKSATQKKLSLQSLPAKGAIKKAPNPKSDPNAYIKQNYRSLSNKQMAAKTGLSEHTIRRKLGEWRLKRPQRV
jgi:hypothetical protein